ncbi:MAG: hemagglutinin repeat-containing protein [Burkholderiales bacterium]|nr:hemagglutinin repeat-containing protein [Burkholderiales bacterium]
MSLSAAALSYDGQVKSSGDFAAALHGDYTVVDKPFYEAAGSVSLAFTGRITVNTELRNSKNLSFTGSEIANNASVHAEGNLTVHATGGDLTNKGTLYSGGHADIAASGNLYNEGATIDTGSLRLDVGGSVYSSTAIHSTTVESTHTLHNGEPPPVNIYEYSGVDIDTVEPANRAPDPHRTTTVVTDASTSQSTGSVASITARNGDITLTVGQDLHIQGAKLHASGTLQGLVGGDIDATSLRLRQSSQHVETTTRDADEWARSQGRPVAVDLYSWENPALRPVHNTSSSEQTQAADIQAGAGLTLYAAGNANYQGSTIHSGADLTLLAGSNLTLGADRLTTTHQQTGTHEQTQTHNGGHTTAQGPILLAAGDTITLHSAHIETGKAEATSTTTPPPTPPAPAPPPPSPCWPARSTRPCPP